MQEIRKTPKPLCPVCRKEGIPVYKNLQDELFGTAGVWDMKRCPNKSCLTYWLDPTPIEEDLPLLYQEYTTHEDQTPRQNTGHVSALDKVRDPYIYHKYGYAPGTISTWSNLLRFIAYIHPAWRDTQEANLFYLPYKKDGLVLDVGCGAGGTLVSLEKKGWIGIGIDFDEKAVSNAKSKGLDARTGDLFSQNFKDEKFDAIVMNHVIEHIPDPKKLLEECRRVLKTGGILVMLTPNSQSRGHRRYGRNWRGLEVPRHLQLFSCASLQELTRDAAFTNVKSFSSTQGILSIYDESKAMSKTGRFNVPKQHRIVKQLRWFLFGWVHQLFPGYDEVAVVIARK